MIPLGIVLAWSAILNLLVVRGVIGQDVVAATWAALFKAYGG